jgi:hypothetical protein
MARSDLDGALFLRTGVYSSTDVLGLQVETLIHGFKCVVRFPSGGQGRDLMMRGARGDLGTENWGYVNSPANVTIRQLGFRIDVNFDESKEVVPELTAELDRLVTDLWWWVAIAALEVPDMIGDLPAVKWGEFDVHQEVLNNAWTSGRFTDTTVAHDRRSWRHAFDHATANDFPFRAAYYCLRAKI